MCVSLIIIIIYNTDVADSSLNKLHYYFPISIIEFSVDVEFNAKLLVWQLI